VGLVCDLCVGEAQRRETGGGLRLVAESVSRLRRSGAVVAQPVRFHDEAQLGPKEVDLETAYGLPCQGHWKAGVANKPKEAPFELGVREREGVSV
jgi:hypothetical protein